MSLPEGQRDLIAREARKRLPAARLVSRGHGWKSSLFEEIAAVRAKASIQPNQK